jgi:hypothetical protein
MRIACQCEHVAHFEKDERTPHGNPGHKYQADFYAGYMTERLTMYGTFIVCRDCGNDCHKESAK